MGLVIDLGESQEVTDVNIQFGAAPTTYELFTADPNASTPSSDAPTETSEWSRLGQPQQADERDSRYSLVTPVNTRYVLLWLTSLPPAALR